MTTTKVFDTTFISACLNEIQSIDLFRRCLRIYKLSSSFEVVEELKKGFSKKVIGRLFEDILIHNLTRNAEYCQLLTYMKRRYPYLHIGEISSFLIAVIAYKIAGKEYYYITDDGKMRKVIKRLSEDVLFSDLLKFPFENFNVTGTIGIIKKLYERGAISNSEIEKIIIDIKNSTFRIDEKLLDNLRKMMKNENGGKS